jgi:hypothetical protein
MFKTILLIGASAMALAATSAEALTFVYTGTIQHYTVATTGIYNVVAAGAQGGSVGQEAGGQGIAIGAHVALTAGTMLDIVVGGGFKRFDDDGYYANNPGGGGGSFVLAGTASPVVIGGGGGGASYNYNGASATASQNGTNGGGAQGGTGGSSGSGGQGGTRVVVGFYNYGYNGGGGGGLNSAGGDGQSRYSGGGGSGAPSFAGGHGTFPDRYNIPSRFEGGFGGGGAGAPGGGGGGGGFSGGGGGGGSFGAYGGASFDGFGVGGGGGSFTRADATDITAVLNDQADGNGYASIDLIPSAVPEPATWGLLTGGFGMIGAAMRRSFGRRKSRLA